MQNLALKIVGMLIGVLLPQVTPLIKEELAKFLQFVYTKAKSTPNPVDDALAGVLLAIFNVETPCFGAGDAPLVIPAESTDIFKDVPNVTDR